MSREVMQQALDALDKAIDYVDTAPIATLRCATEAALAVECLDAIYALRAALAEPAAPQDEPVAHIFPSDVKALQLHEGWAMVYSVPVGSPDERSVPLYTAPPAAPSGEGA